MRIVGLLRPFYQMGSTGSGACAVKGRFANRPFKGPSMSGPTCGSRLQARGHHAHRELIREGWADHPHPLGGLGAGSSPLTPRAHLRPIKGEGISPTPTLILREPQHERPHTSCYSPFFKDVRAKFGSKSQRSLMMASFFFLAQPFICRSAAKASSRVVNSCKNTNVNGLRFFV